MNYDAYHPSAIDRQYFQNGVEANRGAIRRCQDALKHAHTTEEREELLEQLACLQQQVAYWRARMEAA